METMWHLAELIGPVVLGLILLDSIWRKDLDAKRGKIFDFTDRKSA